MYNPKVDYQMPDEIVSETDNFIAQFYALSSNENALNEDEHQNNLIEFNTLLSHPQTPLFLLDIAKRILVDNDTNCGNIIVITGLFNKILEKQSSAQKKFLKDEEIKRCICESILFLLPYTASFFEESEIISCFDNLFKCFHNFDFFLSDKFIDLFNQYIEFLFEEENIYRRIIGLYFVNQTMVNEPNSVIVNGYITEILMNMKNLDFDDKLDKILYDFLLTKLSIYVHKQLKVERMDEDCLFQSITEFFDRFISLNERLQEIEIEFIQKVVSFLNVIIFYFKEPEYFEINSSIVGIVYEKASAINRLSSYQLSESISFFFLKTVKYLDFKSIMQNRQYFMNLIAQLTVYPLTKEITEPEEILYVDYYDIELDNYDISSNRQNVAHFLYKCFKVNRNIIFLLFERALSSIPIEKVHEHHFYLASIILRIVSLNIQNERELKYHIQFMVKFLEMATSLHEENGYSNTEKVFFEFTYLFFINSSFPFIKHIADNEEIIELLNRNIFDLIELMSTFSEDQQNDQYYEIYFTFLCILADKMFSYDLPLSVTNDRLSELANQYLPLCISSDAINLMNSIAVKEENIDLLLITYNYYMEKCYEAIDRFEEIKKLTSPNDDDDEEEEEEEEFNEIQGEEIDDDKLDVGRVLRFINENVFKISQIIRQVDASNFDEEKLIGFGELLITTEENEVWVLYNESIDYFSSLFFKSEEIFNLTEFYIKLITDNNRFYNSEWSIPIARAVSYHPELVDQHYFDMVSDTIVHYIQMASQYGKMATLDCLPTFSLLARLFEIRANDQFVIQDELLSDIMKFALDSLPTEEDIESNPKDFILMFHELGLNLLRLAYYLIAQEFDHDELIEFLLKLESDGQIVCQEMRYMIVMIIQELLKDDENEQLLELKNSCLANTVNFNRDYRKSYLKNSVLLSADEKHPIFDIYPIEGFIFD